MEKNPKAKDRTNAADPKLDAIKHILFGEIVQEYDEEFLKVKEMVEALGQETEQHLSSFQRETGQHLSSLKQEITAALDSLNRDFSNQLTALRQDLTARMEALEASKTDRHLLGDLLQEMGRKLQSENGQPSTEA